MTVVRYFPAVLCLLVFAYVAGANAVLIVGSILRRHKGSMIPIVGGLAGMLGLLVFPGGSLLGYCWLPLLLDAGSVPLFAATLVDLVWRNLRRRS